MPNEGNKSLLALTFLQSFSSGFFFSLTLLNEIQEASKFQSKYFCLHNRERKVAKMALNCFFVYSDKNLFNIFNVIRNVRKKHLRTFILCISFSDLFWEVSHRFFSGKTLPLYHLHHDGKCLFLYFPLQRNIDYFFPLSLYEYFMSQWE